eukprot:3202895-Amphidinium_carterae.1
MVGNEKRYALIVPEGVVPGQSKLRIESGDVVVTVPADARSGDTLELQKHGAEWKIAGVKPRNAENDDGGVTEVRNTTNLGSGICLERGL